MGLKTWARELWIDGSQYQNDGSATLMKRGLEYWVTCGNVRGRLHRIDGPSLIFSDALVWHINGIRHRAGGPAFTDTNGHQEWWAEGRRHRLDGPAIVGANGTKEWWVDGVEIPFDVVKYFEETGAADEDDDTKRVALRLKGVL